MIISGQAIAEKILKDLQIKRKKIKKPLKLGIVLVGNNPVSQNYIKHKQKACQNLGIRFQLKKYAEKISSNKLCQAIQDYQKQAQPTGLLIQLPLPKHLNAQRILNRVEYARDIDCLSEKRMALVFLNRHQVEILPPASAAILEIFKEYKINLKNKNIVMLGYGRLIGRPLSALLLNQGASMFIAQKDCKNLKEFTQKADILISAVGKKNLIKKNMIKKGAVIIDAGTSTSSQKNIKLHGDVEFKKVKDKASLITPVPGGIGPITLAILMKNLFSLYWSKNKKKL